MAIAEMFRLTRPGGYTLINVAAMNMLRGDHSVLSREVRRYSRETLRQLVVGAGFTIVRLTYTNVSLFLPLATVRLAQRWRGLARRRAGARPPRDLRAVGADQHAADRTVAVRKRLASPLQQPVWKLAGVPG